QSGMPLASKQDGDTSGKSRTQADLSRTWIEGCFPAARSNRELLIMCDYSLHFVASRPARVGDKLVSSRFRTSLTRGFAAIGEPDVAVCLLPGTEVAFERDVECDGVFRFFRGRSLKQKVARFRQINLDEPTMHHDALEFPDGQIVLVTELRERQHGTVLQLPAPKRAPSEAAPTERAPVSTMA
ncbi:MAG: hypothetical protein ACXWI1_07035, partial [Croceibacterium sp.]